MISKLHTMDIEGLIEDIRTMSPDELLENVNAMTPEQLTVFNNRRVLEAAMAVMPTPEDKMDFIIAKNVVMFGGLDAYVADFVEKTRASVSNMPAGPAKNAAKQGQRLLAQRLLTQAGLSVESTDALNGLLGNVLSAAAAGGRKMSRKYCKKTPCRKMGFSQRASCHPYKKCSTRRARRGRVST